MLENKETALIVKAKLERLREKIEDVVDDGDFDALRMVKVTPSANGDNWEESASDLIEIILDEMDYEIGKITRQHLIKR